MAAFTRKLLYNDVALIVGEHLLSTLTDENEFRRNCDQVWDSGGVQTCLESGQWKFAMRTKRIDYSTVIEPDFGLKRAFEKPTDWVATSSFCSDEYLSEPILQYVDEAGVWYAEYDEIYVRYVSNDSNYGNDLTKWTAKFKDYVAAYFAYKIIMKQTGDEKKQAVVEKMMLRAMKTAKSHDAMGDPPKFPAEGGWNRSRRVRSGRERGSQSNLIG